VLLKNCLNQGGTFLRSIRGRDFFGADHPQKIQKHTVLCKENRQTTKFL